MQKTIFVVDDNDTNLSMAKEALKEGALGVISKPIDPPVLLNRVKGYIIKTNEVRP